MHAWNSDAAAGGVKLNCQIKECLQGQLHRWASEGGAQEAQKGVGLGVNPEHTGALGVVMYIAPFVRELCTYRTHRFNQCNSEDQDACQEGWAFN